LRKYRQKRIIKEEEMKMSLRTFLSTLALVLAVGWVLLGWRGQGGISTVFDKQSEIRALQERNANLQKENEYKRERIRILSEDRSQQELEVRKQLGLVKKRETTFVLQDQKKK
jgi:cell division protein FtsB